MSSSIPIPPRQNHPLRSTTDSSPASTSTSSFASMMSPPRTPFSSSSSSTSTHTSSSGKGKGKAAEYNLSSSLDGRGRNTGINGTREMGMGTRKPSLMGGELAKSEFTVVDLSRGGEREEARRLVTCVKSSQGFDWNLELFLPSYAEYEASDLETRPDPIEDIHLTEEEVAALWPR